MALCRREAGTTTNEYIAYGIIYGSIVISNLIDSNNLAVCKVIAPDNTTSDVVTIFIIVIHAVS
jgi:hypothetical protein